MKKIDFVVLHMGGETNERGSVIDLLKSIPYLLMKYIPPRRVLNSVLAEGNFDAGMSGGARWAPFQLTSEEYESVVEVFEADGLTVLDAPDWVSSFRELVIWIYEVDFQVPSEGHQELDAVCEDLERRIDDALNEDRDEDANALQLELFYADRKMSEYIDRHKQKNTDQ